MRSKALVTTKPPPRLSCSTPRLNIHRQHDLIYYMYHKNRLQWHRSIPPASHGILSILPKFSPTVQQPSFVVFETMETKMTQLTEHGTAILLTVRNTIANPCISLPSKRNPLTTGHPRTETILHGTPYPKDPIHRYTEKRISISDKLDSLPTNLGVPTRLSSNQMIGHRIQDTSSNPQGRLCALLFGVRYKLTLARIECMTIQCSSM